MKYIFIILLSFSLASYGQGKKVAVFDPVANSWVYLFVYETNNPPTAITGPTLTNSTLAGTLAAPAGVITNAMLAGSIAESKITNLTTDLSAKLGISVAATTATTGTMTTTMTSATQNVFTITPTGACTFNASGGTPGAEMTFIILTSGSSSFVLTWGTNFKTTATLATGVTTAKTFVVHFICKSATEWDEVSRTTAM